MRLNLAQVLIDSQDHDDARGHLEAVLEQSRLHGYDRLTAFALSHLALIAYREERIADAERLCLKSNTSSRPKEYASVVFRNCYYLWQIALERNDDTSVRAHERTLRAYLNRVADYLPEAEAYRAHVERAVC